MTCRSHAVPPTSTEFLYLSVSVISSRCNTRSEHHPALASCRADLLYYFIFIVSLRWPFFLASRTSLCHAGCFTVLLDTFRYFMSYHLLAVAALPVIRRFRPLSLVCLASSDLLRVIYPRCSILHEAPKPLRSFRADHHLCPVCRFDLTSDLEVTDNL